MDSTFSNSEIESIEAYKRDSISDNLHCHPFPLTSNSHSSLLPNPFVLNSPQFITPLSLVSLPLSLHLSLCSFIPPSLS